MSKQSIYDTLIKAGMTRAAALGMLGNMQCESGIEANRLQGDYSSFRTLSKAYVAKAADGSMTKEEFSRDGKGFGLCQWTYYTRKAALWEFAEASNTTIDDADMQTRFAVAELKSDFHALWEELLVNTDLYTCTKLICEQYERPAHNNIDARFRAAKQLEAELADVQPEPAAEPGETYWPPRMLCKGMVGDDVAVLQALLKARGYTCDITGEFDTKTHNMTIAFQSAEGLDQDGIAGPRTWSAILERG